jgi:hypothetical protein
LALEVITPVCDEQGEKSEKSPSKSQHVNTEGQNREMPLGVHKVPNERIEGQKSKFAPSNLQVSWRPLTGW